MPGQPKTRARRELAAFTNTIVINDRVGVNPPRKEPVETFGVQAAEDVATMRACDVLFKWDGDVRGALVELGYDVKFAAAAAVGEVARKVFDEDVIAAMHRRLGNVEVHKQALLARQVEIAKHGEPDASNRAFMSIARVAGWVAPVKIDLTGRVGVLNIHTIMQNPELLEEALAQLGHEPGAPIATSSEARERYEKRVGQLPAIEGEVSDGSHG